MSMEDATPNQNRGRMDRMKYRFRLFRKRMKVMKKLPDQVFPLCNDSWAFWLDSLKFSELYVQKYYNNDDSDDSQLQGDKELEVFYKRVMEDLGEGLSDLYTFKKFNLINVLTHFICNATIWNHHVSMAVSFEYSVDIDYVGLKVMPHNAKRTNIENYVEYCAVVLSRGWEGATLTKKERDGRATVWGRVLLQEGTHGPVN